MQQSSIVQFTSLSGAQNEGPICNILEIGNFVIMLDCGMVSREVEDDEQLAQYLGRLKEWVERVDVVLISHSSLEHLGGLGYLSKIGLKAKVYMTTAVWKMGEMTVYDFYQGVIARRDFELFTLDDIDRVFDGIIELKYNQHIKVDNGQISIIPVPAGHSLGAAIWKIHHETNDILYAIDYNLRKEILCDGCKITDLGKPNLLITDSLMAKNYAKLKDSPEKLLRSIKDTLEGDGNVLIPTDAAGRSLELMVMLETAWQNDPILKNYGLVFLSEMSHNTVEFASHHLEWMSEQIQKNFDEKKEDAFDFHWLKKCTRLSELDSIPQPMVVLATSPSLDSGFSRDLFRLWAPHLGHRVIFTEKSTARSLVRHLISARPAQIEMKVHRKVPLDEQELAEYRHKMELEREVEEKKQREAEQRKELIEIRDEEDADEEIEEAPTHDRLYLPENMRYYSQYVMFPCIKPTFRKNVFGEVVNVEELTKKSQHYSELNGDEDEKRLDSVPEPQTMPMKSIVETSRIKIQCAVQYIEFSGRSNGQSVRNILQQLRPRKAIFINGSKQHSQELKRFFEDRRLGEATIAIEGEVLQVQANTQLFQVKLTEELLKEVEFTTLNSYDIAFIEGQYDEGDDEDMDKNAKQKDFASIIPRRDTRGHPTIYLGEIKYSNLSALLQRNGFKTQFKMGGGVIVNKKVLITATADGRLNVTGSLCPDYFKIRKLIHQQLQAI